MYKAQDYTFRIFWSEDDEEWVGTVVEFPLLSYLDAEYLSAAQGIKEVVESALEILKEEGNDAPQPLMHRKFSGKFALRMTPEQHARITLEAAEQGVSINQLLVSRI